MEYFDAHCHIYTPQFDADRSEVLARMKDAGLGAIVVGTDYAQSTQALELASAHDFLWASVGLHPNDNLEEAFDIEKYRALAQNPKVVAIGECGLDYFRSGGTDAEKAAQKIRFAAHIELAVEVGKPLIIHCRNAHDDMLIMLGEYKEKFGDKLQAVIHFFTGTSELAQRYLDLGCYLSFPGPITYTTEYDESIRVCPLDRMLSETDSPYAAPVPNRGKRNEPVHVKDVVEKLALIKGFSAAAVADQIVKNATKSFGLTK
ncbi:MAG: sec-independent protein translocase protein TatD DNase family protein [Candidatus Adlerbacteria bacterium]|nr:sec-independent protein translocase protein TatD DNase family protein [Candidatus Adlerbacteria bacterium]